jgi:predicted aspartyl protease
VPPTVDDALEMAEQTQVSAMKRPVTLVAFRPEADVLIGFSEAQYCCLVQQYAPSCNVRDRRMILKSLWAACCLLISASCTAGTVVPIELAQGNPIASGRINGLAVSLVVDSGGDLIVLKPDIIAKLGLTPLQSQGSATDAYGRTSQQSLFNLATFEIGSSTFHNLKAAEVGAYAAQAPGDGIIGRSFLNKFVTVYDFAARNIELLSPDERSRVSNQCRGIKVGLIRNPEGINISFARTDFGSARMLWDTGATYSFLKKRIADAYRLSTQGPFYTSKLFALGANDFGPMKFVVLDLQAPIDVEGYIGFNFFSAHVVCIDPSTRSVRIRPSAKG